jgi:hypothetical protein
MRNTTSIATRGIPAFLLVLMLAACGGPLRYTPRGTQKAPDSDASIEAAVNADRGFTTLNIKVNHLAPPERLLAGADSFVVWARQSDGAPWQRIGALNYDAEERTGELQGASVPLTSFHLIITAEKESAPGTPSEDVAIAQEIND